MISIQLVTTDQRLPGTMPPEPARTNETTAEYADSRWRRLVGEFYKNGERALVGRDIAEMSLVCSEGLPHCQNPNQVLEAIDDCTREVSQQTERWRGAFTTDPGRFQHSANRYRATAMKTVLSCRFGIEYNSAYSRGYGGDEDVDCRDCRLLFLDGALTGKGGLCGTLAPLCVAIGRRLGYPLWLVKTHNHCLARWEGRDGERFNIECTSPGFVSYGDEHYRTWSTPVYDGDVLYRRLLANLAPREELAFLLNQRAMCLRDNLRLEEAEEALFHARQLAPLDEDVMLRWQAVCTMRRMIRLAAERGNREGPLSIAVEQVPYPEPVDVWEHCALELARRWTGRLRRFRSPENSQSAFMVSPDCPAPFQFKRNL